MKILIIVGLILVAILSIFNSLYILADYFDRKKGDKQ